MDKHIPEPGPQAWHTLGKKRALRGEDDYLEYFSPLTACQGYERSETTERVCRGSKRKTRLLLSGRHVTFSVSSGSATTTQSSQRGHDDTKAFIRDRDSCQLMDSTLSCDLYTQLMMCSLDSASSAVNNKPIFTACWTIWRGKKLKINHRLPAAILGQIRRPTASGCIHCLSQQGTWESGSMT